MFQNKTKTEAKQVTGKTTAAQFFFDIDGSRDVIIKIAVSSVSVANAKANLESDRDLDFETARAEAKKTWEQQIKYDMKLKQNWRRDRKHFLDMINFDLLKQIFDLISRDKEVIMDLGSYDGYFIKYYSSFNKVVLSDITPYSKLNLNDQKFKFCLLNGRDLKNINSLSLDVVFSIDTLIRLDRQTLKSYFSDFGRIVKEGGYLILHIPDLFNMNSIAMSYTPISRIFF